MDLNSQVQRSCLEDIQDLIGEVPTWPPYMIRLMFLARHLNFYQRMKLAVFLIGNGLHPFKVILWCQLRNNLEDPKTLTQFSIFVHSLASFDNENPTLKKYYYWDLLKEESCWLVNGMPVQVQR